MTAASFRRYFFTCFHRPSRVEKQRLLYQEKLKKDQSSKSTDEASTPKNASQIKAQMEEQLKKQRLAMAQKRLQEQGKLPLPKTSTPTIITQKPIAVLSPSGVAKPGLSNIRRIMVKPGSVKPFTNPTIITKPGSTILTQSANKAAGSITLTSSSSSSSG